MPWIHYELRDIDKLTELYSIRIPEVLKIQVDRLSSPWRKRLNDAILITMAKVVADANFDPHLHLTSSLHKD